MSLQQIKRDIEGLKKFTQTRPLQVLLNCNADDLTDSELTKLLMQVPIRQLPTSVLLSIQNRVHGSNFKCLQDLPAGYLEKMRTEYWENDLQQLKKELNSLKQKVNSENLQAEYFLSSAREEVKRKIDLIGERLREKRETCVLSEADKEEILKKIRESSAERIKNLRFQRWVKGV